MKPGIYDNLSSEEYHGHKQSISRSALLEFDKSPYRYWAKYLKENAPVEDKTPAMIFGSAVHILILEPHLFDQQYAVKPERVLLKDVGRKAYDQYVSDLEAVEKSGKILLHREDYIALTHIQSALNDNLKAQQLLSDGVYEQSYFWKDEHSGLLLKARPDIQHRNMIVDLKTCADASPRGFQNAMAYGGYHVQGAMIQDAIKHFHGVEIEHVVNVCIEKTYPYSIGIYFIDPSALEAGREKYKNLCLKLKNALEQNNFEDYEVQTIGLPAWAI